MKSVTLQQSAGISGRLRHEQRGFSLVEIMVTLAVLGLVALSGFPFLQRWKEKDDLRRGATKVANMMLAARMRAVVDRRVYTVQVDYATDACSVTPPIVAAQRGGSVDIYLDDSDPDCLSLSSQDIAFRPNSTADAAGFEAVYLRSSSANVPVRYRVKVLGATGKVSVEKWEGGAWLGAY